MGMKQGTRVHNQLGEAERMEGIVIETPPGQAEPDGFIWVSWSSGLICQELPGDVTPIDSGTS